MTLTSFTPAQILALLSFSSLALLPACGGIAVGAIDTRPGIADASAATPETPPPSPQPPSSDAFDASPIDLLFDAGNPVDSAPPPAPYVSCTPLPGCTSALSCPANNGCTVCSCTSWTGLWDCPMAIPCDDGGLPPIPGKSICPSSEPPFGSSCSTPADVICNYGCSPNARCLNGQWTVASPACSPPPPGG